MAKSKILLVTLAAASLAACGTAAEQPAAGDTAAVRMEERGAVTEKTMPSGEVDTAAVTAPTGRR